MAHRPRPPGLLPSRGRIPGSAKHLVKVGAAPWPRLRHVWVHAPRLLLLVVVCSRGGSKEPAEPRAQCMAGVLHRQALRTGLNPHVAPTTTSPHLGGSLACRAAQWGPSAPPAAGRPCLGRALAARPRRRPCAPAQRWDPPGRRACRRRRAAAPAPSALRGGSGRRPGGPGMSAGQQAGTSAAAQGVHTPEEQHQQHGP